MTTIADPITPGADNTLSGEAVVGRPAPTSHWALCAVHGWMPLVMRRGDWCCPACTP